MRKEALHPGEDEALLYFVQVRDELIFHGPADVHHKEDSDTFSQAFIFAILPKFYAIQPRTQQEAEKGIGQNRQAQQNKSSSDPCKKCTCCIQHCNIKHQPAAVFQTMLGGNPACSIILRNSQQKAVMQTTSCIKYPSESSNTQSGTTGYSSRLSIPQPKKKYSGATNQK